MCRSKLIGTLASIILFASGATSQGAEFRYTRPIYKNLPLDYCRVWAKECGTPAADAFCKRLGHHRATGFSVRLASPPTRVIGDGRECRGAGCNRISEIVCTGGRLKTVGKGKSDSATDVQDPDIRFGTAGSPNDCD
jgi:hypothetical protein